MSVRKHPFVVPITPSQARAEEEVSEQVRAGQESAVIDLLAEEVSPDQIQAVLTNASGFAEAMTKKFRDPKSPPMACKEGCFWCCYQIVGVSVPEVFRVVRYINREGNAEARLEIVNRLHMLDRQTRGLTPQSRTMILKSCAFLKDGHCSIYEVRPLACAEFTSYDVLECKRNKRRGFNPGEVVHEKARMLAYYSVQQGLADGLRKALPNADTSRLELTAAVVQALNTPDVEKAWLSGDRMFAAAHMVSSCK